MLKTLSAAAVAASGTAGVAGAVSGDSDEHELVVEGTGPVTRFSFGVTGTVEGFELESTDTVGESTVEGQVSTQDDTYRFTGELTQFAVIDGSPDDLRVTVDGEPLAVEAATAGTTTSESEERELVVEGTGPTTRFEFEASSEVYGSDLETTDTIYGYAVEGQVSTQDDRYYFSGDLDSFTVTMGSADDIRVTLDGEEVTTETAGVEITEEESHVLEVRGTGPMTQFSFAVSGSVRGSELEDTDTVRLHSVDGQVSTLDDTYEYTGRMNSFEVTEGSADDIVLVHDGTETTVAELDG
jgi:hypothetical protein